MGEDPIDRALAVNVKAAFLLTGVVAPAMADRLGPRISRYPSRRPSTPQEVAAAVVFLASDDAANIHGAVLPVDGVRRRSEPSRLGERSPRRVGRGGRFRPGERPAG